MNLPSVPDARMLDADGYPSTEWRVFFEDLISILRAELKTLSVTLDQENSFI